MSFKCFVRGLKDWLGNISRRKAERKNRSNNRIVPDHDVVLCDEIEGQWAKLPPKLLINIIRRVEESEASLLTIVCCASVCKSWRKITKQIVKTPQECGRLTFPISLKQPGPHESPIQCFVKWDRPNSVFRLYFGMTPSEDATNKLLLAAKRIRRVASINFVISLVADDFSQASNTYVGKLRSNFRGTKYTIYDSQPLSDDTDFQQHDQRGVPPCNYIAATVSHEITGFRKPTRTHCALHSTSFDEKPSSTTLSKANKSFGLICQEPPLVLKNKMPLWNENLQMWCLNFKGRGIRDSRRNFQLLAPVVDASHNNILVADQQEKIILQFGKIGQDIFAMDYNYPLSAFQAFAICLTLFTH